MSPVAREVMAGAAVAAIYGVVFLLGEAVRRHLPSQPEVSRKTVHLLGGLTALTFPYLFQSHWTVFGLALGFLAIGVVTKRAGLLQSVHGVARASSGAFYFPLAIYLIFVLSRARPVLYFIAILVMSISDTLAALVGGTYGRVKFQVEGNLKSLEGSTVFFVVTFLCVHLPLLLVTGLGRLESVLIALVIAVLVTGFEAISLSGSDNIFVPFGTYYVLAKMTRLPLPVVVDNVVTLLLIILLTTLLMVRLRLLTPSGVIGVMLLNYAAISLCGFSWFLPLILAQLMYYLLMVVFVHSEGREKVASFQLKVVLYIALIPTLLIFVANTVKDTRAVYPEYLTSITAQLAIIGNYFFAKSLGQAFGSPGWSQRHRGILEAFCIIAASAFIAAPSLLFFSDAHRLPAIGLVLAGTWVAYALNFTMDRYRGIRVDVFEYRRRLISAAAGVTFVWVLQRILSV